VVGFVVSRAGHGVAKGLNDGTTNGLWAVVAIALGFVALAWLITNAILYRHQVLRVIGIRGHTGAEMGIRRATTLASVCVFLIALFIRGLDVLICGALAALPWLAFYAGRWVFHGFR
jgi:hypothetical protein